MFEHIPVAPPDSILGLNEIFEKDSRPEKINLTVGVFKDEQGRTPILESVRLAERRIIDTQKTKSYLPIEGGADFASGSATRLGPTTSPCFRQRECIRICIPISIKIEPASTSRVC
jgi:aspartate/tyrosine/aromatic aminotransferase